MSHPISFCRGAELRPFNVNDHVCVAIQPFIQQILDQFVENQNLHQSIEKATEKYPAIASKLFDIDSSRVEESFSLKENLLFPEQNPLLYISYRNTRFPPFLNKTGVQIIQDEALLPQIHHLLHLCGQSNLTYEQICQQIDESMVALLDEWVRCSVVKEQEPVLSGIDPTVPGIYRLQHAALLCRTATTGLLVDPHLHSNYGLAKLKTDILRSQLQGLVDGILITHPHYDHWHYPTLMMFPPEMPIFVPKVPRASIMCEDMAGRLRSLGFTNVIDVDWYAEPIWVGDIEVNVMPFYGEQPLVPEFNTPIHPDMRNWGNTYLLNTEYYKTWLLADSGQDPMGTMLEVADRVKQQFGDIDLVVSNFQPLSYNSIGTDLSAWGIDIVANLLSNPRIFSVTNKPEGAFIALLGPKGVAELCAKVDAKACLPYADSWAEVGEPGVQDESLIPEVMAELQRLGCATQVIPWKIGEGYLTRKPGAWSCELGQWVAS